MTTNSSNEATSPTYDELLVAIENASKNNLLASIRALAQALSDEDDLTAEYYAGRLKHYTCVPRKFSKARYVIIESKLDQQVRSFWNPLPSPQTMI